MDWANVLWLTCLVACACYICLRTYHHHPSLLPTQQSPQDESLAKAAPVVKAAHDLNKDFHFSMFQFKASYIHTYIHAYIQGPSILCIQLIYIERLTTIEHYIYVHICDFVLVEGRYYNSHLSHYIILSYIIILYK